MDCQTVYLNIAEMKLLPIQSSGNAWISSVVLLERWLGQRARLDNLMEDAGRNEPVLRDRGVTAQGSAVPASEQPLDPVALGSEIFGSHDRARCQHLLYGTVRNFGRLDVLLGKLIPRRPRARLRAVLLVAAFELFEAGAEPAEAGQGAKIVHHAVAQAKRLLSPSEVRLVNAVLRQVASSPDLHAGPPPNDAGAPELARFYSHPEWLVRRWLAQFGADATVQLLKWNQTPAPVYARWRGRPEEVAPGLPGVSAKTGVDTPNEPPAFLQPAPWAGFYVVSAGHWPEIEPLLAEGALYLQDPATLTAPGLLDPQLGETVVDLCAAPGGKSLLLSDMLELRARQTGSTVAEVGRVVSVDLPDPRRIGWLKANLAKARRTDVVLVQADVLKLTPHLLKEHNLPSGFPAVLLDVPCSNTGVMRHRVDVKWRLRESDIAQHAGQQQALLEAAARLVAAGGRLVYSTCSLEQEENEGVIEAFLRATAGRFVLEKTRSSRPWENGCDGAGAFLLRRKT
jgi:16S rRNA (cytosine967-C5)-methyltransferase